MEIARPKLKSLPTTRPPSKPKRRLKQWLGPDWQEAYGFMLPAAIFLFTIVAIPFLMAFLLSFTNTHRINEIGPYVGLRNYVGIWQDDFFRTSVWITAQYTFWTVFFKFLIGLIVALLLNRLKKSAGVVTALLLLPWIMPEMVRAVTWKGLLDPLYGIVNRFLLVMGLIDRAIPFFGDPETALASVIIVNIWAGVPLVALVLLAGLKGIDRELYEAAAIDGANVWRQFLHITLPGLRYVMIVTILLNTIWSFNDFTPIFVLTRGGPLGMTLVYTIRVVEAARNGRFGVGVAMGMTIVPILGLLIFLLSRYMIAGNQKTQESLETMKEASPGHRLMTRLLHLFAWPFQTVLRLMVGLFWLINNAAEQGFEAVGRLFGRLVGRRAQFGYSIARRISSGLVGLLLVLVLFFELIPFYWVFITSFKTTFQITTLTNELWPTPWTLDQFNHIFAPAENFVYWLKNTVIVSLVTPVISTFVGALSGYGLARLRWRGSTLFSAFVLIAYMMPGVLLLIPLLLIFKAFGLLENLLALIIAYPSFTLPFALWMMMGYYTSIPAELEDAGLIDGCTRFQVFTRIVLPLTTPALMAVFLFSTIHAWGEFLFALAFLAGDRGITLPVGMAYMVNSEVAPWGELMAMTMVMAVPVLILYLIGQRLMVSGLITGAIKGGG
jgi:multiple sugar transport system permease protein